jgi:hypothetical protein
MEVDGMSIETKTLDAFKASLARKAKAAGTDLTGLQIEGCSIERTWGDLVGYVFWGAAPEVNERCAAYFTRWMGKNDPRKGGYGAQRSLGDRGVYYFARYDNGAKGWYRGALPADSKVGEAKYDGGPVLEETREGFAASTTYYPCAE